MAPWFTVGAQVASTESNFGEVGICQLKMFSGNGICVFNPPQLCERWTTKRRPDRPRMAPQVNTYVRMVAG